MTRYAVGFRLPFGVTCRTYRRIHKKINSLDNESASLADFADKSLEDLDRAFRESSRPEPLRAALAGRLPSQAEGVWPPSQ